MGVEALLEVLLPSTSKAGWIWCYQRNLYTNGGRCSIHLFLFVVQLWERGIEDDGAQMMPRGMDGGFADLGQLRQSFLRQTCLEDVDIGLGGVH